MIIEIKLDTIDPITDEDRALLSELAKLQGGDGWNNFTSKRVTLGTESEEPVKENFPEPDTRVDDAVEAKKAEAKKQMEEEAEKQKAEATEKRKAAADAKRKAAAEAKAEKEAAAKAEEPEEDDTPAALESDGPTLDDAVKLASGLITSGNSAAVKSVLKDLGVRKVGELPQEKIAQFIDQLDAL